MIDWIDVTSKLRKQYGSLANCAKKTGVCAETIRQLNRGQIQEPRFSHGMELIAAYGEALRNDKFLGCGH